MDKEFLGNFKIIRKVGEGGMAIAFLAHHKEIPDHRVILKQLKDPRHGEKFKREANNLAKLNDHHNICRIYDFFNEGDRTIIVMEYIEGATLKEVIETEKKLPLNLFLKLAVDLLRIFKYAHDRKIYHRDIKPGNIMVDKQGEIKVIDFGIAKDATDPNETAAGVFSGTPMFAPLEQFDPLRKVDWAKADIYSLGTTLFLMITGRMPFGGNDWNEYAENKRLAEPICPSAINSEVPAKLDAIILKSIARLPEDRYSTVGEMLEEFEKLRSEKVTEPSQYDQTIDVSKYPYSTTPPAERSPSPSTRPPKKRPTKGLIVTAIMVLVAIPIGLYLHFGLGLLLGTQENNNSSQPPITVDTMSKESNTSFVVPAKGRLEIVATPSADFYVNDSLIGKDLNSKTIELDSGEYGIRLENKRAKVGKQYEQNISILPGRLSQITHDFEMTVPPWSAQTGSLLINIEPKGDVYLDDKKEASGQSSVSLDTSPGRHVLKIVNQSQEFDSTITKTVEVDAGKSSDYSFVFNKKTVLGELRVGSIPNQAVVFIDGKRQNRLTPCIFDLPAGSYNIRVWLESQNLSRESTLVVIPGETVKFAPEFE